MIKNGELELKKNIVGVDTKKNIIKTNYAKYNEVQNFTTIGPTEIKTAENILLKEDVIFNDKLKNIISKKSILQIKIVMKLIWKILTTILMIVCLNRLEI